MAVKIKDLDLAEKYVEDNRALYKDLSLDIVFSDVHAPAFNTGVQSNDSQVDVDIQAIRNSLQNLFNTKPGQRFLFPKYGLDLNQFVFEPVSKITGQIIGEIMYTTIRDFEPSVHVENITVQTQPEDNTYEITLVFSIPSLNITDTYTSVLDLKTQSFIYAATSRNT